MGRSTVAILIGLVGLTPIVATLVIAWWVLVGGSP
jgi:hypothetical protein